MNTELYKIQEENFSTIITYYLKTTEIYNLYSSFMDNYLSITENYNKSLTKLIDEFSAELIEKKSKTIPFFEKLSSTNSNSIINDNNNFFINIEINPNEHNPLFDYISFFLSFLSNKKECIDTYLRNISSSLKSFSFFIKDNLKNFNEIQGMHLYEKQRFLDLYSVFEIDNPKLLESFKETENKLIEYCVEKKNNPKSKNLQQNLNNINIKMIKLKEKEKEYLNKAINSEKCGINYKNNLDILIKKIKQYNINILTKFQTHIINVLYFYNTSYSISTQEIEKQSKFIQENKSIDNYSEVISKNIKNINNTSNSNDNNLNTNNTNNKDTNLFEYKTKNYEMKVFKNNIINKNEVLENFKILTDIFDELSYEEKFDDQVLLDDEDIYFIAKKMFDNFISINKSTYPIETETNKLKVKQLTNKLLYFSLSKREEYQGLTQIKPDELKLLTDFMTEKEYQEAFLKRLNNYRALGVFEIPKKEYEIICELFMKISDKIFEENDLDNFKSALILSQTFYLLDENKKKIYIINKIKNHKLFQSEYFWKSFIEKSIENEIANVTHNENLIGKVLINVDVGKRNKEIVMAQLLPYITSMNSCDLGEEKIKNVVMEFIEKYQIGEEQKNVALMMIQANCGNQKK